MNSHNKVLACVDKSRFSEYVTDYAAWAALRMSAPMELLHIIDRHPEIARDVDHSGTIGIDAQSALLDTLSDKDAERTRAARESGRVFLNALRDRAAAQGLTALDTRQRYGQLEETLAEQENDVCLFVLGRRGMSAERTQRDLGRHVENVVRQLHKPILTVTEHFSTPQRIMIAYDGGVLSRRGVHLVANSELFKGLPIDILMAGKPRQDAEKQLEVAKQQLVAAGFDTQTHLIPGDAERVIADQVRTRSIDLLIMGAYSHSLLRRWIFGSKTTDLLRAATLPTLLLR
jgi:nucleotide-binding universal stress UspA family protein